MNYASLDELYNNPINSRRPNTENNYDNIIKKIVYSQKNDKNKTNIPDPSGNDENYLNYKDFGDFDNDFQPNDLEKKIENFENKKEEDTISIDLDDLDNENEKCVKFLDHVSKCEKCRKFIMKKLNLTTKTKEDKQKEEMLDIVIFILTGIFVLFLLDSFMNLGKYIKK